MHHERRAPYSTEARPSARTVLFALGIALEASGCHAHVRADAKANESGDIEAQSPARPRGALALTPAATPVLPTRSMTAFIGVTPSVSLAPSAASTPVCPCLAAVVGPPTSPAFAWQGPTPVVDTDAIVVAIGGEATPCDVPMGGRGPSIQAVGQEEGDVIVTLEQWRPGIPVARGAIVLRPAPGKGIVFRSSKGLPFARAAGKQADCRITP